MDILSPEIINIIKTTEHQRLLAVGTRKDKNPKYIQRIWTEYEIRFVVGPHYLDGRFVAKEFDSFDSAAEYYNTL